MHRWEAQTPLREARSFSVHAQHFAMEEPPREPGGTLLIWDYAADLARRHDVSTRSVACHLSAIQIQAFTKLTVKIDQALWTASRAVWFVACGICSLTISGELSPCKQAIALGCKDWSLINANSDGQRLAAHVDVQHVTSGHSAMSIAPKGAKRL